MFSHSMYRSGSTGMNRSAFLIWLVFFLLVAQVGISSAASPATTTATTTPTPGITGGSIYFETDPPGATIWLDNIELGTSPFTYYSERTGKMDVRVRKRLFEDYTDKVVVIEGERVVFSARLTMVSRRVTDEITAAPPATTTSTVSKSTIIIPTPWPTSSPESLVDPAVVIGAVAVGIGFFVMRRQ